MLVFTTTNPSAAGEKRGDGEDRLEKSETKKEKEKKQGERNQGSRYMTGIVPYIRGTCHNKRNDHVV